MTASSSHLSNLIKAVNQAGFKVIESVYGLIAVGEVVPTPEEKELGCLLVDFGGQTVSVGIYFEGSIRFSREIAIGSDLEVAHQSAFTFEAATELGAGIGRTGVPETPGPVVTPVWVWRS